MLGHFESIEASRGNLISGIDFPGRVRRYFNAAVLRAGMMQCRMPQGDEMPDKFSYVH
jgi:hypothetical protein